jgi:hypothetical protein
MINTLTYDKHSNLLQTLVNYGCRKFYNIGPWKLFEFLATEFVFESGLSLFLHLFALRKPQDENVKLKFSKFLTKTFKP